MNFVCTKWITQACRPLQYCENESFGSTRSNSDHSMLILTLSHRIYAEHDTRPRFRVLDTKPLRQGDTAEYQGSLTNLAKIYLAWARRSRDAYLCTGATFDEILSVLTDSTFTEPETTQEVELSLTITEYKPAAKSLISSSLEENEFGPDHSKV